jgi:hypothetical protein
VAQEAEGAKKGENVAARQGGKARFSSTDVKSASPKRKQRAPGGCEMIAWPPSHRFQILMKTEDERVRQRRSTRIAAKYHSQRPQLQQQIGTTAINRMRMANDVPRQEGEIRASQSL